MAFKSLAHKIASIGDFRPDQLKAIRQTSAIVREEKNLLCQTFSARADLPILGRLNRRIARNGDPDLTSCIHYGPQVKAAMKLKPDSDVLDAVSKMMNNGQGQLIEALQYTRLPYPKTWLEYKTDNVTYGILASEILSDDDEFEGLDLHLFYDYDHKNMQLLPFTDLASGHSVKKDGVSAAENEVQLGRPYLTRLLNWSTNFRNKTYGKMVLSETGEHFYGDKDARTEVMLALSTLLLLNSRSGIIKIAENETKTGKVHEHKFDTIEFDIDEIMRKQGLDPKEARAQQAETLVRGHFKVLKSIGARWWSPHLRNKRVDVDHDDAVSEQLGRERVAGMQDPDAELDFPSAE